MQALRDQRRPECLGLRSRAGRDQPATSVSRTCASGAPAIKLATPPLVPSDWPGVPSKLVKWQNDGLEHRNTSSICPKLAPGTHAPLVVVVHGGPWTGRFAGQPIRNLVQMLAAEGWATVFEVNPRGSTGYGAKFAGDNKNVLGGADYRDIMTGVDTVLRDYPLSTPGAWP